MDRGLRIAGGMVLVVLAFFGGVPTAGKAAVLIVGLYGFITGLINFCPLGYFILREKRGQRKKTSADHAFQVNDVKELEFFEGMSNNQIKKVLEHAQVKQYEKDETVLIEGKDKKIISIIFSGQFKIVKTIAENEQKIIATVTDGDTFGEMSFFDNYPPCVSVISTDNSKVLEIDELAFNDLIRKDHDLAVKIFTRLMHVTSSRIRAMNEQISALGTWVLKSRQHFRTSPV
jgi:CRP-like cAMP-binding protein